MWPLDFWALNAYNSEEVKVSRLKFCTHFCTFIIILLLTNRVIKMHINYYFVICLFVRFYLSAFVFLSSGRRCGWMKHSGMFSSPCCWLLSCFYGDHPPIISGMSFMTWWWVKLKNQLWLWTCHQLWLRKNKKNVPVQN